MSILYITDIDFSSRDAPPIHVKEIINHLAEDKNEMFLIGQKKGKIEVKAKTRYFNLPKIPIFGNIFFNIKLLIRLPFYIMKDKIQVIYTRQSGTLISPAIISRLFLIPYITELNGNIEEEMKLEKRPKIFIKLARMVEKICYKNAKKVIVVSKELRNYILQKFHLPKKKVVNLENGVNINLFKHKNKLSCRKQLKLNLNNLYGGYVGGLQNWQGISYIISSTKEVIKRFPNYKLIVVGDGPEKKNLINLTKSLKLESNIFFKGVINHDKVPLYINSFDLSFCYLTKIKEGKYGTPFKVYEYLSCESPTIMSDIKGITKLFKKNVIVAKSEDSKDLANQIIKILNDKQLMKNLAKNGREFILQSHSWKNVAERTQKVIEDAINESKNNSSTFKILI